MHRPWHDDLSLFLAISAIDRARDSLCRDTAYRLRASVPAPDDNHVLAKIRGYISRTHREHVDIVSQEFQPGCLSDRIQGELAGGIGTAEDQGNVSGYAGNVDNGPAARFSHRRYNGLHGRDRTEQVGFKQ